MLASPKKLTQRPASAIHFAANAVFFAVSPETKWMRFLKFFAEWC
jgi:hypothetical protein